MINDKEFLKFEEGFFKPYFAKFIEFKRGKGEKVAQSTMIRLRKLNNSLNCYNVSHISEQMVEELLAPRGGLSESERQYMTSSLRQFCSFLTLLGIDAAIVPPKYMRAARSEFRPYIFSDNELHCIVREHNYLLMLNELYTSGQITIEQYRHEQSDAEALISYLGMGNVSLMDTEERPLRLLSGDIVLICSDGLYKTLSDQQIELGWAIIAGRGTGTPLFYSRPDGEDSTNGNYYGNNVLGAKGNDTFKSPIVTAANHFRTDMVGQGEAFTNPTGDSSLLMIARGAAGVVLVNAGDQAAISVKTSLPDGDYTDMVKDAASADWKVEGGKLSGTIGAKTAVFLENLDALNAPSLSAASTTGSSSFQSDTLDVTLTADNGTNLKYTTSEGATGSFKSGDVITIGSSTEAGNNITVTLTATGADGKSYSFDFDFTKTVPNVAYLVLPDGWNADNVYCYAYDSTSNAAWPGEKMELDKDEKYAADGETWYKYTVPADITNPRVIFWAGYSDDDNSCRYPADQAPGLQLSGSIVFRYTSDTDWKWYKYGAEIPTSTPTPTP